MSEPPPTLSFDTFWGWLLRHPNCILRAGTESAILYDDEDLHWHFGADDALLYVQVIRGKRLLGEIVLESEGVAYVQALPEEPAGEWSFELVHEGDSERRVAYFFALSHGFDESELPGHERAVH